MTAVLDRGLVAKEASAAANLVESTGRSSPLGAAVLPGPRSVVVLFARVGEGTSPRL
jgi:hypothetical protein